MSNGIDYSVFYYTYSTIAQTLAGGFGFLGAVVLFQMQGIHMGLDSKAKLLMGWCDLKKVPQYELEVLISTSAFDQFADLMRTEGTIVVGDGDGGAIRARAMKTKDAFLAEWALLRATKKKLAVSLYLTGGTIISCLVLIPCTNAHVNMAFGCAMVWLCAAIVGAVASMLSYLPIVKNIAQ